MRSIILVLGAWLTKTILASESTCENFGPTVIPLQAFGKVLSNYSFGPCSPFLPATGSMLLYFPPISTLALLQINFAANYSDYASDSQILLAVQSIPVSGVYVNLSRAQQGIALISVQPGSFGAVELATVSPPSVSSSSPSSSSSSSSPSPASSSTTTTGVSGPCVPDMAYEWTITNLAPTEIAVSVGVKWIYRLPTGVSRRSCQELAANSHVKWSWTGDQLTPITPVAPSLTPTQDQAMCISGLNDQDECRPSAQFDSAFEWCQFLGSRLCGADEIVASVGDSVECVEDGLSFWSSTFCAESGVVVVGFPSRTRSCEVVTVGTHNSLCCGDQAGQPWLGAPLPTSSSPTSPSTSTSTSVPSPAPSVFNVYASLSPTVSPTAFVFNSTIRSEIRFLRNFSTIPADFDRAVQWGLANTLNITSYRISKPAKRAGSVYYAFNLEPGSGDRTGTVIQSLRNLVMDPQSSLHTNSNMTTLDSTYFRTGLALEDNTTVLFNNATPSPAAALLYVPSQQSGWGKKELIIIAILAALAFLFLVLLIIACCCWHSRKAKGKVQADEGTQPIKLTKIMVDAAAENDNDPPNPRLHLPPNEEGQGTQTDPTHNGSSRSRKKPQLSPRSGRPLRPQRPRNNKPAPGRSTSRSRDPTRASYHDEADVSDEEVSRSPPRPGLLPATSVPQPQQPIIR